MKASRTRHSTAARGWIGREGDSVRRAGLSAVVGVLFAILGCTTNAKNWKDPIPDERWLSYQPLVPPSATVGAGSIVRLDGQEGYDLLLNPTTTELAGTVAIGSTLSREELRLSGVQLGATAEFPEALRLAALAEDANAVAIVATTGTIRSIEISRFEADAFPALEERYREQWRRDAVSGQLRLVTSIWACRSFEVRFVNRSGVDVTARVAVPSTDAPLLWGGARGHRTREGRWFFEATSPTDSIPIAYRALPLRLEGDRIKIDSRDPKMTAAHAGQVWREAEQAGGWTWAMEEMLLASRNTADPTPHLLGALEATRQRKTEAETLRAKLTSKADLESRLATLDRLISLNPSEEFKALRRADAASLVSQSPEQLFSQARQWLLNVRPPDSELASDVSEVRGIRTVFVFRSSWDLAYDALVRAAVDARSYDLAFDLVRDDPRLRDNSGSLKEIAAAMERSDGWGSSRIALSGAIAARVARLPSLSERISFLKAAAEAQQTFGDASGSATTFQLALREFDDAALESAYEAASQMVWWAFAREDFELAVDFADRSGPPGSRVRDANDISVEFVGQFTLEGATSPFRHAPWRHRANSRDITLLELSRYLAVRSQTEIATEAARRILDPFLADLAHMQIVLALRSTVGNRMAARHVELIQNHGLKLSTLSALGIQDATINDQDALYIVYALAEQQRFIEADQLARTIRNSVIKYLALCAAEQLCADADVVVAGRPRTSHGLSLKERTNLRVSMLSEAAYAEHSVSSFVLYLAARFAQCDQCDRAAELFQIGMAKIGMAPDERAALQALTIRLANACESVRRIVASDVGSDIPTTSAKTGTLSAEEAARIVSESTSDKWRRPHELLSMLASAQQGLNFSADRCMRRLFENGRNGEARVLAVLLDDADRKTRSMVEASLPEWLVKCGEVSRAMRAYEFLRHDPGVGMVVGDLPEFAASLVKAGYADRALKLLESSQTNLERAALAAGLAQGLRLTQLSGAHSHLPNQ